MAGYASKTKLNSLAAEVQCCYKSGVQNFDGR